MLQITIYNTGNKIRYLLKSTPLISEHTYINCFNKIGYCATLALWKDELYIQRESTSSYKSRSHIKKPLH
jgi:hypothetical protein